MSELRVGFIGTGRISDLHALEYLQNPRARIVAVCDTVAELAQQRGAAWGVAPAQIYSDHREMLARAPLDLVEILVPHHLHCPVMLDAAAAGVNISLQKPMALNLADAAAMVAAADAAGIVFKVFENFIFYPPVMRAKALIDAGEIGDPLTIRIKSNSATSPDAWPIPRAAEAWRFTPEQCGGGPLVFDDGHHKFALGWHFMGQAEAVHAWIGETEREPGFLLDAPAIISWKFPGGRYGSLEVVYSRDMEIWSRYYAQDDRVEITGTRGVIEITRGHGKLFDRPPVILYRDRQTRSFSDMEVGWEQSFILSTRHFIDALHAGEPPVLSGAQGCEVLRFALAAQESARSGQPVTLA